jgi:hypothetical protein
MNFSRVTIIIGARRSGTTWIGKIFDSHPDVLYRHEPDLALSESRLPYVIDGSHIEDYLGIAAAYGERLARESTLKSGGQLPVFPKSYHSPRGRFVYSGMIHAMKLVEKAARHELRTFPIPDLVAIDTHDQLRVVIKSVTARGRARVFLRAMPGASFILLLRHPCGQVASTLRGYQSGKFDHQPFAPDLLLTPNARRYGLTQSLLDRMPLEAQLAWDWVLLNELAIEALAGQENARILVYEELCAEPAGTVRDLFRFMLLEWNSQTEAFIQQSTRPVSVRLSRRARYYGVFQNPQTSANKWRNELDQEQQRLILDVVRRTSLAKYWPDTAEAAERAVLIA